MDLVKSFTSRTQFSGFTENDVPSTFTDTVAAGFAFIRREELSDADDRAMQAGNAEVAKAIKDLGGNAVLVDMWQGFGVSRRNSLRNSELKGELDKNPIWRGMHTYAREAYNHVREFERRFPSKVPDDAQILENFKDEAAELRASEQHTMERGSGFAAFLGTAGAVMTDPLILATLPLGAEIAAGRTFLATVGRTAAIESAIGVGVEIPIQAKVAQFKAQIESPWSFRQSAINVLAAGLGSAVIGGTISGGVFGARKMLSDYRAAKEAGKVTPTQEIDDAERILEDTLSLHDENPLRSSILAEGEPEPPAPIEPHERAFETARAQHNDNNPVDVADDVRFVEPDDGVNQVLSRSEDPAELVSIDPREVQVDAKTFQFKSGSDGAGVTDALRDVTKFDQRLAGVSLIWERADGAQFIADGHQRAALGIRAIAAGQDSAEVRLNGFILRETDGVTAIDARRMAAVKNMAEGSGSALDAAKILRDVGPMGEAMLPPLPPRSALVRQARGLANLGDNEFLQIVNGIIPERHGALIGAAAADPKLQQAMIDVLRRTKPFNETQARSIIDQVRTVGTENRVTADLFGAREVTESLYLERAQVLDAALSEAKKDRAVFGRLLSEEGRITEAGHNRLDRDANFKRMKEASDATNQISRLANAKGPISEALTEAARQVKAGKKTGDVTAAFLKTARRTLLESDSGGREAGGARSGGNQAGTQGSLTLKKGQPVRLSEMAPNERAGAMTQMLDLQIKLSMVDIYAKADANQKALVKAATQIVGELGEDVTLANPGIKKRSTAKGKLSRKQKAPGEMTDIVRLGFMVRTPDIAARVINRLSETFELLDEGVTVTGMGYVDHKALVRFKDGLVGEVQLWDPAMAQAKFGAGEDLYAQVRSISPDDLATDPTLAAQVRAAEEASKDLYASAIANASPEWRRTAMMVMPEDMRARVQAAVAGGGNAGAAGKASKNALRESSEPDSNISTGEARDQSDASSGTKKPSTPPAGVSRTTAGRASQLKNLSAIDAPPRPIVRQVNDTTTRAPDATRTGTVPDTEYESVMAQMTDLLENRGAMAKVGREVNGELETRTLASEIESLDALEETLERIRICSFTPRNVA